MSKKKIIIALIIILFIILIVCVIGLNILQKNRNSEENLEYINSDELDEGTISPDMIHVVIALYEGNLNPKAISKATYHFINNLLPEYRRKCVDDNVARSYFLKNKNDIYLDIGIDNEEEFINLINEINKLSTELEFESSRFDRDTIKVKNGFTEVMLYIKYKDNNEIGIKVKVLNQTYSNKPSVQFSI